jgi:hypothetical protein
MMGEPIEQGAPVNRSEPRISVHSWNGRFDVTIVAPRSYRWLRIGVTWSP